MSRDRYDEMIERAIAQQVTAKTVGDFYNTDAFARAAVHAGMSKDDAIRCLLADRQRLLQGLVDLTKVAPLRTIVISKEVGP